VEAFTAFLVELLEATVDPTGELTPEAILFALARDLVDGELDAATFGERIDDLPDAVTLTQSLSQDPLGLRIPNSRLRVSQLRFVGRRPDHGPGLRVLVAVADACRRHGIC
jgi:hypothetical protein